MILARALMVLTGVYLAGKRGVVTKKPVDYLIKFV